MNTGINPQSASSLRVGPGEVASPGEAIDGPSEHGPSLSALDLGAEGQTNGPPIISRSSNTRTPISPPLRHPRHNQHQPSHSTAMDKPASIGETSSSHASPPDPPPLSSSSSSSSLAAHREIMKRGPFGLHLANNDPKFDESQRILGKRPARSPPSPTESIAPTSSNARATINAAAYSKTARKTRSIARHLLEKVTCASCRRPYESPVTLPCGHSTCQPCITARVKNIAAINQATAGPSTRTSHVPPRLPLCTMTVPCSVYDCPRSAIGRGLGVWAGYSAAYGPPDTNVWIDEDASSMVNGHDNGEQQASSAERGSLPVDGFVVGAENESLRLGVIGPQPREKANTFALSPFPIGQEDGPPLSLRADVTLAKAVAVLQRYAQEPPAQERRYAAASTRRARRPLRGFATPRRHISGTSSHEQRRATPQSSSSSLSPSPHRRSWMSTTTRQGLSTSIARGSAYTDHIIQRNGRHSAVHVGTRPGATKIARHFRPMLGGSEANRESGTVAGVTAADTDEDEEERSYSPRYRSTLSRRRGGAAGRSYSLEPNGSEADEDDCLDRSSCELEDWNAQRDAHISSGLPDNHGDSHVAQSVSVSEAECSKQKAVGVTSSSKLDGTQDSDGTPLDSTVGQSPNVPLGTGTSAIEKLEEVFKLTTPEHLQSDLVDTLECQLCYLLFFEPTTTPCGHTFCRSCLARSLDHSNKCPLCRTSMPSFAFFQDHPRNQALMELLTSQLGAPHHPRKREISDEDSERGQREGSSSSSTYPQEDLMSLSRLGVFADSHTTSTSGSPAQRASDIDDEDDEDVLSFGLRHLYHERQQNVEEEERQASSWMPIFVCTLAFPSMPTNLHIFEPRYKLMIRRCLTGPAPPRFGMVLPSRTSGGPVSGLSEYGTMLEIKNHTMLLDGRSMLETVGWRRFKLLETSSLDGYTTGRVEYFDDLSAVEVAAEEEAVLARNREILASRAQEDQRMRSSSDDAGVHTTAPGSSASAAPEESTVPSSSPLNAAQATTRSTTSTSTSSSSSSSPQRPLTLSPTMPDLIRTATTFIEVLRTQTQPGLFEQILTTYGAVPPPMETDRLTWWLGMVLPIDEHAKSLLLPERSPRRRLEMIALWIEKIQGSWRRTAHAHAHVGR